MPITGESLADKLLTVTAVFMRHVSDKHIKTFIIIIIITHL